MAATLHDDERSRSLFSRGRIQQLCFLLGQCAHALCRCRSKTGTAAGCGKKQGTLNSGMKVGRSWPGFLANLAKTQPQGPCLQAAVDNEEGPCPAACAEYTFESEHPVASPILGATSPSIPPSPCPYPR